MYDFEQELRQLVGPKIRALFGIDIDTAECSMVSELSGRPDVYTDKVYAIAGTDDQGEFSVRLFMYKGERKGVVRGVSDASKARNHALVVSWDDLYGYGASGGWPSIGACSIDCPVPVCVAGSELITVDGLWLRMGGI
jgi:hypothetical protein